MKTVKFLTAVVLAAVVMGIAMPTAAHAQTAEQEQEQKLKVKCTTGSYGQSSTCTAEGQQKQKQKIVYVNNMPVIYHAPAATALDLTTGLVAGATVLTGAGAFVLKRKLNA